MSEQPEDDTGVAAPTDLDAEVASADRATAAPVAAEEAVEVEAEGVARHRPGLLLTEEHALSESAGPSFRLTPTES
ncbi:hypothetical protein [Streptomyces crystallinus]|uniref:Uncharacterized protein n=1 Tax=Streptomyces crystallinus TaxID=68191 RepID=A0ABP3QPR9_9ACTN